MIKEIALNVVVLAFLALLTAGAKHLHSGECRDHTTPATAHASHR